MSRSWNKSAHLFKRKRNVQLSSRFFSIANPSQWAGDWTLWGQLFASLSKYLISISSRNIVMKALIINTFPVCRHSWILSGVLYFNSHKEQAWIAVLLWYPCRLRSRENARQSCQRILTKTVSLTFLKSCKIMKVKGKPKIVLPAYGKQSYPETRLNHFKLNLGYN